MRWSGQLGSLPEVCSISGFYASQWHVYIFHFSALIMVVAPHKQWCHGESNSSTSLTYKSILLPNSATKES